MSCDLINFGYRLSIARSDKGFTQYDMADKLGITQSAYSKIENGKRDVSFSMLCKLSTILDVSVSWLTGESIISELTDMECLEMEKFKKYIISIRDKS